MNYDQLKIAIEKIICLQKDYLIYLKEEINYIIDNNIKNNSQVEYLFDQLLNLFQTTEVLNLYKKLGRYYYFINSQLVIDYLNYYQEMYLDDNKKMKILE